MGRPTRTIHAGEHFGHLTAIECCGHTAKGDLRWKLSCICGTVVVRRNTHLWRGRSLGYASSCGCITKRQIKGAPKSRADVMGFTQKEKPGGSWWAIYAAPELAFDVFAAAARRREAEAGWKVAPGDAQKPTYGTNAGQGDSQAARVVRVPQIAS